MENSLKLTIVGAGSPYTPELLEQAKNYEDRLPIREIVLYDIDSHRLEIMEAFCRSKEMYLQNSILLIIKIRQEDLAYWMM